MTTGLFERVVVPVASERDAENTARALRPYLPSEGGAVVLVHVVEKAGGAPDKASVEQAEEFGAQALDTAAELLEETDALVETRTVYGTDVAERIVETAAEEDATAVVFAPRRGSRWTKLLTGDVANSIFDLSDRPVVVVPDSPDDEGDRDD